ncbi:MAG: DMT family transporter [Actinobacteria bacterium]|nr:DMT family transporter [Actinomycetota bacterium]
MVASVVFALPLGVKLTGQRVGRRALLGAGAVCVGLGLFRFVATPSGGHNDATSDRWIVGIAVVAAIVGTLVIASLGRSRSVRAALLGTAAGVVFGLLSGLTKATVDRFGDGFLALVGDWHIYTLIAVGLSGFLLIQSSLQAGSLAPAVASETELETVTGIVVGIVLLRERLDAPGWGVGVSVLALEMIFCGLVVLSQARAAARPRRAALEPAPG